MLTHTQGPKDKWFPKSHGPKLQWSQTPIFTKAHVSKVPKSQGGPKGAKCEGICLSVNM